MLKVLSELEPFKNQLQEEIQATMMAELQKAKKEMEEKNKKFIESEIEKVKTELGKGNQTGIKKIDDETITELKDDINTHEENFEKVQENFLKLNNSIGQIENNQKILNEILTTLKSNIEEIQKKVDKVESMINTNSTITNKKEKKDDKTNPLLNSINIEESKKERYENLLTSSDYLDNKEITEVPVHGSGFITNHLTECVIDSSKNIKEKLTLDNFDSKPISFHPNNVKLTKGKSTGNKLEKNIFYNMASPTELNDAEMNNNLTHYLKKFIVPMQNYENVLEIEFEFLIMAQRIIITMMKRYTRMKRMISEEVTKISMNLISKICNNNIQLFILIIFKINIRHKIYKYSSTLYYAIIFICF